MCVVEIIGEKIILDERGLKMGKRDLIIECGGNANEV